MNTISTWVNQHDTAKLLLITLVIAPVVVLSLAVSNGLETFALLGAMGMVLCAVGAYWIGNWKWIFIPLLVMLAWIIPFSIASQYDPNAMETPLSIIVEAPFWVGIPALIGAGVGYLIKRLNQY